MSKTRHPVRISAVAAVIALAACGGDVGGGPASAGHDETTSYTVPAGPTGLSVRGIAGRVQIGAAHRVDVKVREELRWSSHRPAATHSVTGTTLTLSYGCPPPTQVNCSVSYIIEVPSTLHVEVATQAGEVRLTALTGPLSVTTTAGQVTGRSLASPTVDATTTVGAVDLEFARPPTQVEAHTRVGTITIRLPPANSYDVTAMTTIGSANIDVPVDHTSNRHVAIESDVGAVTVTAT